MTEEADSKTPEAPQDNVRERRVCFDAVFFSQFLSGRARALCTQQPGTTPVVLLHLVDGAVLDLCHIDQLFPDWMAVSVYHDSKTCDRMDLEFVPYVWVTRVTVSLPPVHERRIGFQSRDVASSS